MAMPAKPASQPASRRDSQLGQPTWGVSPRPLGAAGKTRWDEEGPWDGRAVSKRERERERDEREVGRVQGPRRGPRRQREGSGGKGERGRREREGGRDKERPCAQCVTQLGMSE